VRQAERLRSDPEASPIRARWKGLHSGLPAPLAAGPGRPQSSARGQLMLPSEAAPPVAAQFNENAVTLRGPGQRPAAYRTRMRKPGDAHSFLGSVNQIQTIQRRLIRTAPSILAVEVDDEH
jgi:hypothetical protein